MLLYNELGRHTPPPPPYSLSKRDATKIELTNEDSQRSAPPPPPPYLSSTPRHDCTIPSIDDLRRQIEAWDDSYLSRDCNAILLSPVHPQCSAGPGFDSQQSLEGPSGNLKSNWSFPRVPAHPVEPRWTPGGILGYPGPPLVGATAPLPGFPQERLGSSRHRNPVFTAGTRIGPTHGKLVSQPPSTVSLGLNVAPCAAEPPIHTMTMMDQKPLHTFKSQAGKEIASLVNNVKNSDATGLFEPCEPMCPSSVLPSQQAIRRRATLSTVPTSQDLDAVKNPSDGKSLLDANEDSSSNGDPSDGDDESTHVATVSKDNNFAFPARSGHEAEPSKDFTTSQRRDRGRPVPHFSHRRQSASARFMPYNRRQSKVTDKMEPRFGATVDVGCARSPEMQSNLEIMEDEKAE
ncbi:MAG: hypothetical protein Q9161_008574 [Pseudevernia consocians]